MENKELPKEFWQQYPGLCTPKRSDEESMPDLEYNYASQGGGSNPPF
jgi:hypothetical protein